MNKFSGGLKGIASKILVYIFNGLPVKKNKVFIFSYYGSQYGCSPKYISEYLVENYPKDTFDIVWAFNDMEAKKNIMGIRKVRNMSIEYFYELCTSKVIITNFRTTDMFKKRKNQYYIQTWHSSLRLKQIEMDAEKSLPNNYVEMAKKDSLKCDLLLSGCKFSTEIFEKAFWYSGKIFEHGTPRNDIFFAENSLKIKRIKKLLNIDDQKKIILYAPTFRKGDSLEVYSIDYGKVVSELSKRFNGEWIFLVKLHPHLISKSNGLVYGENMQDVTEYDDIQELLVVSDILISDYSSLMFDFALTERPCFLYVPDIEEYTNNDRKLYFDINELPFIKTTSNESLIYEIKHFNNSEYITCLKTFATKVGSFENGGASKEVAKHIEAVCFK
ncbi:MAG: CDP-glycerol glycerophosphotransferase family protein [Clostridium sp.]